MCEDNSARLAMLVELYHNFNNSPDSSVDKSMNDELITLGVKTDNLVSY